MAYKGKHVVVQSCVHFIEELRDFLVQCGWSRIGPSEDQAAMDAQDDSYGHILGHFLHSNGEDGNQDIPIHLGTIRGYQSANIGSSFSFLSSGIDDSTTTVPVDDGTQYENGCTIMIGDEIILVGTVSSNNLLSCTRGYAGTTEAAHLTDEVVLVIKNTTFDLMPVIEVFAFRDLDNYLAQSSGSATWTIGSYASTGTVTGLTGYNDDRFNYTSLIQIYDPDGGGPGVPGPDHGKMRWIEDYTSSSGVMTYQKFTSAPGSVHARVLSGGFLAPWSRTAYTNGSSELLLGTFYNFPVYVEAGINVWLYGCKDGFAVVYLNGSTYRACYFGNYVPFADPVTTVVTSGNDVSAGAQTIKVDNVDMFTPGQVVRLVSQSVQDWIDNEDRSSDTLMGATPGDWDDLDPDEIPTELVKVDTVGADQITLTDPTIYSYKAGAVLGEDPRPVIRPSASDGLDAAYKNPYYSADGRFFCAFRAVPYENSHASSPTHRKVSRCYANSTTPWNEITTSNEAYNFDVAVKNLLPGNETNILTPNRNRNTQQLPLVTPCIEYQVAHATELSINGPSYNCWNRTRGVIPFGKYLYNSLSANSEDTVKQSFAGKKETMRVFDLDGAGWTAFGPEIAP